MAGGAVTARLVALIRATHTGIDRLLSFDLERPTGFEDPHLDAGGDGAS